MKKTFGHSFFWLALLALVALFACACSGDDKQAGGATEETQIAIEDKTVAGVSEKGPFTVGSAVHIYELEFETLGHTGRSIPGKIASDRGDFRFTHLNLECQFAFMEVSGYYRNENTGKQSTAPITLNALVDLSDKETANINLLTHLAFERTLFLVNEGKPVKDAKQQAEQEILKAFHIENELIGDFEGLSIFKKGEGNAALLAISSLMQADLAEGDFSERLANFAYDIEKDGVWNDSVTATAVADWASAVSLSTYYSAIRSNIKGWKISDIIPDFEKSMDKFWWENYGLGDCDKEREGVVKANTNALSKLNGVHFICKDNLWRLASDIEKDTFGWEKSTDGTIKKGNVTDSIYVFDKTVWRAADNVEAKLGGCVAAIADSVGKVDSNYFICKDSVWRLASDIEKDTYKWKAGKDDDVKFGDVVKTNCYVYEDKVWRAGEANDCSLGLRGCTVLRQDTVGQGSDKNWYKCVSQTWRTATDIEKDTATWGHGEFEGEIRQGQVNEKDYYIYEVRKKAWRLASILEYDTYQKKCTNDGVIFDGTFIKTNKYVCDDGVFRAATENEVSVGLGCTNYTEGTYWIPKGYYSFYKCHASVWKFTTEKLNYGEVVDPRDGKKYKTIGIKKHEWLAENLNYETESGSYCYDNDEKNCSVYGRLYAYEVLLESCPSGWHVPDCNEWNELLALELTDTMEELMTGEWCWNEIPEDCLHKAEPNTYGFSVLPAGSFNYGKERYEDLGSWAHLWVSNGSRFILGGASYGAAFLPDYREWKCGERGQKKGMYSVRCIKDEE